MNKKINKKLKVFFQLLTDRPQQEILEIQKVLEEENGNEIIQIKKQLAFDILKSFHTIDKLNSAWEKFQDKTESISFRDKLLSEILIENKILQSKRQFKRLIDQKGIKVNSKTIDKDQKLKPEDTFKIGKRNLYELD